MSWRHGNDTKYILASIKEVLQTNIQPPHPSRKCLLKEHSVSLHPPLSLSVFARGTVMTFPESLSLWNNDNYGGPWIDDDDDKNEL